MLTIVVVVFPERTSPRYDRMSFNFLGYRGWIFPQLFGDAGVTLFVIQPIFYDISAVRIYMLILFYSRSLLKTEMQQKKNNISRAKILS